jgi:hypothetical protein
MKNINVGEYGIAYDLNVNYDLSAATSLVLSITRPDGTKITGAPIAGLVPLVTEDEGTFAAKQYCTYLFKDGDLTLPGDYLVRLIYTDSTKRLISDPTAFTVNP